jgi:hypothetical protein
MKWISHVLLTVVFGTIVAQPVAAEELKEINDAELKEIDSILSESDSDGSSAAQRPAAYLVEHPDAAAALLRETLGLLNNAATNGNLRADLVKGAEALAAFGNSLEVVVPKVIESLSESRDKGALALGEFDPFALKQALETVKEQAKTIQDLQQAEITRLREELERAKNRKPRSKKSTPSRTAKKID